MTNDASAGTGADLADLGATGSAELVRSGQASPRELVDAAIERLEKVDPELHVLVRERYDAARAEADGDLPDGPFRGVPILLKDLGCHVAGEVTAYGTSFLRELRWPSDSFLWQQLRAAGFVALGRTSVPEFGTTVTTEPASGEPTRNPWDPTRSAGGSSGGSAAAVAARAVPVAHANDGGGSIRIPAAQCGLVGLKPTRARVSQGPDVGESWAGATIDGCVARTVRDAAGVLDVIRAPQPGDPYWPAPPVRPYAEEVGADPGRLRIGFADRPGREGYDDDPQCREAVQATARLLEGLGHSVEEAVPAAWTEPAVSGPFVTTIGGDMGFTLSVLGMVLGREVRDDELEPRNAAYRHMGSTLSAADYLGARALLAGWVRAVAAWWAPAEQGGEGFDLLVTPTVGAPPPRLGYFTDAGPQEEGRRITSYIPWTAQANITGQPAVSLPLHQTPDGVPVGVQLIAAYGREDVLVRVAAQLEAAAPWADRRPQISA